MCSAKFHCKFQILCNNLEIHLTMGKIEPLKAGNLQAKSQGAAPARTHARPTLNPPLPKHGWIVMPSNRFHILSLALSSQPLVN
jgi:hypothetical protein